MKRSYEQLKLYFSYINQLKALDEVTIQIDTKQWKGRLRGIKNPRYLLKVLDLELPHKNEKFPEHSQNKNEFHDADMASLAHHISWIREVLWNNGVVPYNDKNLID